MPRSLPCVLTTLVLLVLAAAPASAATRPDARAFTKATLAFDLARGKAIGRAERVADQRRAAAADCLETLRAAPRARRQSLFLLYFVHISDGYFVEDEPLFARWVRSLKAVRTQDPALRSARKSLGRSLTFARRVYAQGARFCEPVQAWAGAGWSVSATPTPLRRLKTLGDGEASAAGVRAAGKVLRTRGGDGGSLAASVLREGIDERDEKVADFEDPIVVLLRDEG